mmetsp:Transcript_3305/g.9126  ORF Transcript_3305/g.9126 Transcript_3305/m.9126 type:complete len:243 (-) Transcript_3305:28-756(-)
MASDARRSVRRFALGWLWFVLGMVLCYVIMVGAFVVIRDVTLDHLKYNGWSRVASRITAAMTVPIFALFLLAPPGSRSEMFLVVLTLCSHLVHLAILWSDLRAFDGDRALRIVAHGGSHHPLWARLPWWAMRAVGGVGYVFLLLLVLERVIVPGFDTARFGAYGASATIFTAGFWAVFAFYFLDRLIGALLMDNPLQRVVYPLAYLTLLLTSALLAVRYTKQEIGRAPLADTAVEIRTKKDN